MALDDDIRILGTVGLFESFTPEQLRLLAFGAERLVLRAGRDNSPANFVSGQAPASVSCMFQTVVGESKNLFRVSPLQLVSIKCHKTPRAI